MGNVYTPGAGFAQSTYVDQMATALPGSLANASDQWLIDTAIVAPDTSAAGLVAGIGVVLSTIPAANREGTRTGINNTYAKLPATGTTLTNFGGILVRNQQMDSNVDGDACWFANHACNVLRANRVGGRVWVRFVNGTAAPGGSVYWIISNTTSHDKMIGAFSGEAIGADTVEITSAVFKSESDASTEATIALVEFGVQVP